MVNQGLLRIAIAVRWIGYGLAALCVIGAVAIFANRSEYDNPWVPLLALIPAVLAAGIGKGLAWIIEGFAAPRAEG